MESGDLEGFETVARSGSITHASEELHTVQSNVTARIKLLEDEVGVPLFRRHSRGVVLTPTGEQLLPYAVRIGQLLNDAIRIAEDRDRPRGTLRIGSLETTAALRVPSDPCCLWKKISGGADRLNDRYDLRSDRRSTGLSFGGGVCRRSGDVIPNWRKRKRGRKNWSSSRHLGSVLLMMRWHRQVEPNIIVFREGCTYREQLERLLGERGVTESDDWRWEPSMASLAVRGLVSESP